MSKRSVRMAGVREFKIQVTQDHLPRFRRLLGDRKDEERFASELFWLGGRSPLHRLSASIVTAIAATVLFHRALDASTGWAVKTPETIARTGRRR